MSWVKLSVFISVCSFVVAAYVMSVTLDECIDFRKEVRWLQESVSEYQCKILLNTCEDLIDRKYSDCMDVYKGVCR